MRNTSLRLEKADRPKREEETAAQQPQLGDEAASGSADIREVPGEARWERVIRQNGSVELAALLLVAAVLAVYANSLRCPFVFDDHVEIIENPAIRQWWPPWDFFFVRSANGAVGLHSRPVVALSFALDYAVGGLNTLPYHLTNLAIHVLAGLALFGVVRRTFLLPRLRARFGRASAALALAVALLWAVHPLQTESVTYITQRYESTMGLFYLLAVYGLIRCGDSTHSSSWGAVTVAAALLSLGSKEVAVSLPIMILLYDRVLMSKSFSEIWRRRWGMYLGLLAAWAAFAVVQLRAAPRPWAGYALRVSWFEYACSQPGVILHYLRLVFWPHPLVLDYGWPPAQTVGEILPGAMVVAALLAATGYALWRWSPWGLLGAWFFLILAPTSTIMPLYDLAFEHRMYLPLAAVLCGVVCGAFLAAQWLAHCRAIPLATLRMVGLCTTVAAGSALGIVAFQRNAGYQSEFLILQDAVANVPRNFRAHTNLGVVLAGQGRMDEAIAHYQTALEIGPGYAEVHNNLANALARQGKMDKAIVQYREALKIRPDYVYVHNNLGLILAGQGQIDEAIAHYRKAVEFKPDFAVAHNNLGVALAGRGQVAEAIAHYQTALEIRPDYAEARYNLEVALAKKGPIAEALAHYQAALEIKPNDAEAHYNLGLALAGRGQVDNAIAQYRKAVKIKSDYAEAHYSLGVALAKRGEVDEAIAHYQAALEIRPDYAEAHYNLGVALAGRGEVDRAIAQYRKAVKIRPNYVEAHYNLGLALAKGGQVDEAIGHYQTALGASELASAKRGQVGEAKARYQAALEIWPDCVEAHYNLGLALARRGQLNEAIAQYQTALEIKPDYAEAQNGVGVALAKRGQVNEAIAYYQTALEIRPDYADAHYNLGIALAGRGQVDRAIAEYRKALKIKPDDVAALTNLAWILATHPDPKHRDGAEAIILAHCAAELTPNDPSTLDTLAAAYAEAGRFAAAAKPRTRRWASPGNRASRRWPKPSRAGFGSTKPGNLFMSRRPRPPRPRFDAETEIGERPENERQEYQRKEREEEIAGSPRPSAKSLALRRCFPSSRQRS